MTSKNNQSKYSIICGINFKWSQPWNGWNKDVADWQKHLCGLYTDHQLLSQSQQILADLEKIDESIKNYEIPEVIELIKNSYHKYKQPN